jgi:type IV pilus assembly protein PilV
MLKMERQTRGFTLIEVLVTLVILVFGLLGIAGLMVKGQRASFEAYQRQQALALANDMAERIKINRTQAALYQAGAAVGTPLGTGSTDPYTGLLSNSITNCGAAACTAAELAAYDLALWDGLLKGYGETVTAGGQLVGGIIGARGCIENIGANTFRVSVAWQGNDDTVAPTTSLCGQNLYGTETRRRLVSVDMMLI